MGRYALRAGYANALLAEMEKCDRTFREDEDVRYTNGKNYRSLGEIAMKKLPDERELLELLEMARNFEQQMREQCDRAKLIYDRCEKQISEISNSTVQKNR